MKRRTEQLVAGFIAKQVNRTLHTELFHHVLNKTTTANHCLHPFTCSDVMVFGDSHEFDDPTELVPRKASSGENVSESDVPLEVKR
jgi:hypothetical protein